jgi:hypothetical protein
MVVSSRSSVCRSRSLVTLPAENTGPTSMLKTTRSRCTRRVLRHDVQAERHQRNRQQHAHLDHQAQHQRPLAEDFAPDFLVVDRVGAVFHQVGRAWRGEEPIGKLIALNHQPDRLLRLLLQVDHVLAFAAHVGRMQQQHGGIDKERKQTPAPPGSTVQDQKQPKLAKLSASPSRLVPPPTGPAAGSTDTTPPATRGALKIAAARHADHAERDHRHDQPQVGCEHFINETPPSGRQSITIGSEAKISTARCASEANSLPSTIAAGRSGRSEEHLVGLALFLAGDRSRGKARRHHRRQHVLARKKQVRPSALAPPYGLAVRSSRVSCGQAR